MMSDAQVQELAVAILQPIFGASAFRSVETAPKVDDDGESSLLVTVHFTPGEPADARRAIEARLALWNALQEAGDHRFPHFRYDFGEDVPSEAEIIEG